MPKLLLHIGTHKTGTTSIQRFLGANRRALRERGLWYPSPQAGGFPKHYAHHRIAHAIAGREPNHDIEDAVEFFRRIRSETRSDETVVISAEPMYRHVLQDDGGVQVVQSPSVDENSARHRRYAHAVRRCIGDFDVTVLIMIRRQDVFGESLYAEQVLSTGYYRSAGDFVRERRTLLDFSARIADWEDAFGAGSVSVRPFEPSGEAIEAEFVRWVGLEWDDSSYEIGPRRNVTPPRAIVEYKRLVNQQPQTVSVNSSFRSWLEDLAERLPDDQIPDLGRHYLTSGDRADLLSTYGTANRELARRLFQRDELFTRTPPIDMTAQDPRPLSFDQFRSLTQALLLQIAEAGS